MPYLDPTADKPARIGQVNGDLFAGFNCKHGGSLDHLPMSDAFLNWLATSFSIFGFDLKILNALGYT
jgi:hypothetical protein